MKQLGLPLPITQRTSLSCLKPLLTNKCFNWLRIITCAFAVSLFPWKKQQPCAFQSLPVSREWKAFLFLRSHLGYFYRFLQYLITVTPPLQVEQNIMPAQHRFIPIQQFCNSGNILHLVNPRQLTHICLPSISSSIMKDMIQGLMTKIKSQH